MRTYIAVLLLVFSLITASAYAQADANTKPLIPAAKKVEETYVMMKKHPGDSLYEVQYLLAFPHDYQTFEKVYDPDDGSQLNDQILDQVYTAMMALSKKHPELVGIDLMELGRQADYAYPNISDGPEMLQLTIVKYAVGNTRLFIQLFDQFSEVQKKRLVTMLANVEAFGNEGYPYETLIEKLKSAGAKDIASRLKQAKIDRIKKGRGGSEGRTKPSD